MGFCFEEKPRDGINPTMRLQFKHDPDNAPLERAGIYCIRHVATGKRYIGMSQNVAARLREHAGSLKGCRKLREAINEFGLEAFVAEPLVYAIADHRNVLPVIEADLIVAFDAIENGFNTARQGFGIGPYGPAHSRACREAHARPEVRAKYLLSQQDEELRKRRGEAIKIGLSDPAVRAKMALKAQRQATVEGRAAKRAEASDPAVKARRLAAEQRSEVKARRSAAMLKVRANEELEALRIAAIRVGNQSPERNAKIAASRTGTVWITNGTANRAIRAETPIPEGWRRGCRSRVQIL